MTREIRCSCQHEQQDKMYGKGVRVHNLSMNKTKAKCTVYGSTKILKP